MQQELAHDLAIGPEKADEGHGHDDAASISNFAILPTPEMPVNHSATDLWPSNFSRRSRLAVAWCQKMLECRSRNQDQGLPVACTEHATAMPFHDRQARLDLFGAFG